MSQSGRHGEEFGFDFHCCTTSTTASPPIEATRFGKDVEPLRLFWMEDPTPIAVGEVLNSIWDVQHLITNQLIDYARASVTLSPVSLAAAVALDISIPNFGIQEHMVFAPETQEVFRGYPAFADGYLTPNETPGLGVEYDDEVAARFPYDPKYLPVARRTDGSVHDW